jgi:hypothetical protein
MSGSLRHQNRWEEQIIVEIAAKEAMEKRIKEGGCSLPHQRGWLENVSVFIAQSILFGESNFFFIGGIKLCFLCQTQQISASYTGGFFGMRVGDPLCKEEEHHHINIWSDIEKCIFLDRFLHHPKDFCKITSFLKNKSTKDCIQFYYNPKKTFPYKNMP